MKILIADDNPTNLKLLAAWLEADGHTAIRAKDGVEGMALLERETVDAIISDVLMPNMDGYRFVMGVRSDDRFAQTPFMFYAATYGTPADEQLALDFGADRFIRKPAPERVVLDTLKELITDPQCKQPRRTDPKIEADLLRQYSERLVLKLREKNKELLVQTEALRESEARIRAIFQTDPEGILVISPDDCILEINPAGLEMLEVASLEEAVSQPLSEYVLPAHRIEWMRDLHRAFRGSDTLNEFEMIGKNGRRRWLEARKSPLRNQEGGVYAVLSITRDVTLQKAAAEDRDRLHEAQSRLAAIVQSSDDAIISKSPSGVIQSWNSGAEHLFGFTKAEAVGQHIRMLIPEERRIEESWMHRQLSSGERIQSLETVRKTKEGKVIDVTISLWNIVDSTGRVTGVSMLARPIHDQALIDLTMRKLNASLEESNNKLLAFDKFRSEFLSTASHEMRTPLTIIREFSSLIADGIAGPTTESQQECVSAVLRNCDRLTSLLNDLLDLAKIESGRMQMSRRELDIKSLLTETITDFSPRFQKKCQSPKLTMRDDLPTALGDRDQISQALVNLLGNASKFTNSGGHIELRAHYQGSHIKIQVIDNGIGIEFDDMATIFDAFTQGAREEGPGARGTGLGLAITRKLIEAHDGHIGVESVKGKGSTFSFTLPVYTPELEQKAFVADAMRTFDPTKICTLVFVAPRLATGIVPKQEYLSRAKAWCDSALSPATTCPAITSMGMFVYLMEMDSAMSTENIEVLLEGYDLPLLVECEEVTPETALKCMEATALRIGRGDTGLRAS